MPIPDIFPHELRARVPPLDSQEGIPDPMVHVKFFTGEWIWYVTEGSPDDVMILYFSDSSEDPARSGENSHCLNCGRVLILAF